MDWPSQSPDLNPIENLWGYLKGRLETRIIHSTAQLLAAAREEWNALPQQVLQNLIESMPRRIAAVIRARGGATKY